MLGINGFPHSIHFAKAYLRRGIYFSATKAVTLQKGDRQGVGRGVGLKLRQWWYTRTWLSDARRVAPKVTGTKSKKNGEAHQMTVARSRRSLSSWSIVGMFFRNAVITLCRQPRHNRVASSGAIAATSRPASSTSPVVGNHTQPGGGAA